MLGQVGFGDGQKPLIDPLEVTLTVALVTLAGLAGLGLCLAVIRYWNRRKD